MGRMKEHSSETKLPTSAASENLTSGNGVGLEAVEGLKSSKDASLP